MTIYYVDSVNGLNTNAGTQALPLQTYARAVQLLANGDTILLKRDCVFEPVSGFFSSIATKTGITISDYGTGGLPLFDAMTYEPSGATDWTHEGSGVWSKLFGNGANGNSRVKRLWIGSTKTGNLRTQRSIGTAMRRAKSTTADNLAAITANLNATDIWWPAQGALGYKLYMYTGSTTVNPPTFYNGLALQVADFATIGGTYAVLLQSCSNCLVENVESWGSGSTSFIVQSKVTDAGPNTNLTFRNCVAKYFYTGGFRAGPEGQDSALPKTEVRDVLFSYCTADSGTSAQEQEPDATNYNYLTNVPDAFAFRDSSINCRAEYCTSINSLHVAFTMGTYNDNRTLSDNCGFYRCKAFWDTWHTYGRAATAYNCSSSCYISECDFDGQTVCSQINGAPYVYRNVWRNMRVTTTKTNVSHAIAITAELLYRANFPALGNDAYVRNTPTGVRFAENIIINPVGPIIRMVSFNAYGYPVPDPVIADGTVEFINNICLHQGAVTPWFQTVNGVDPIGVQKLRNNAVFTGTGNPAPTASINGSTLALNAAPGCASNISVDPLLDLTNITKAVLALASPCRGAGMCSSVDSDISLAFRPPGMGPFSPSSTITYL